jgi:methylene-tetrahydromethanopterin dehydrogenase
MSPIASDAGCDQVIRLTAARADVVPALARDAIFCRPPGRFNDTGMFIGGRDLHLVTGLFQAARRAIVGDFQVGLFGGPHGACTTSAAVVALVEDALRQRGAGGLAGRRVAVFGPGPVGLCTAVLAARQSAQVRLCQPTVDDQERVASRCRERHAADVAWVSAKTARDKREILADTKVARCTARAGLCILERGLLEGAGQLLLAADTNAVPPRGIEGIETHASGASPGTTRGRAVAIGG